MPAIRAVIFDLDDTLLDHATAIRWAVAELYGEHPELGGKYGDQEAFQRAWIEVQERHYPGYVRGSLTHAAQKILRIRELWRSLADLSEEECFHIYDHFQALYARKWRLFPDVFPCLAALTTLKLGLISNGWGRQQREKLALDGLLAKFEIVVISSEVGMAKPDPLIFRMACAALGVPPAQAMYVGDLYELDVQGAQRAGLVPVWLRRNAVFTGDTPAILTLSSLFELAAAVQAYNRRL